MRIERTASTAIDAAAITAADATSMAITAAYYALYATDSAHAAADIVKCLEDRGPEGLSLAEANRLRAEVIAEAVSVEFEIIDAEIGLLKFTTSDADFDRVGRTMGRSKSLAHVEVAMAIVNAALLSDDLKERTFFAAEARNSVVAAILGIASIPSLDKETELRRDLTDIAATTRVDKFLFAPDKLNESNLRIRMSSLNAGNQMLHTLLERHKGNPQLSLVLVPALEVMKKITNLLTATPLPATGILTEANFNKILAEAKAAADRARRAAARVGEVITIAAAAAPITVEHSNANTSAGAGAGGAGGGAAAAAVVAFPNRLRAMAMIGAAKAEAAAISIESFTIPRPNNFDGSDSVLEAKSAAYIKLAKAEVNMLSLASSIMESTQCAMDAQDSAIEAILTIVNSARGEVRDDLNKAIIDTQAIVSWVAYEDEDKAIYRLNARGQVMRRTLERYRDAPHISGVLTEALTIIKDTMDLPAALPVPATAALAEPDEEILACTKVAADRARRGVARVGEVTIAAHAHARTHADAHARAYAGAGAYIYTYVRTPMAVAIAATSAATPDLPPSASLALSTVNDGLVGSSHSAFATMAATVHTGAGERTNVTCLGHVLNFIIRVLTLGLVPKYYKDEALPRALNTLSASVRGGDTPLAAAITAAAVTSYSSPPLGRGY